MSELTRTLEIAIAEHRHDFVYNVLAQVMTFLERQGFTFEGSA